MESDPAIAIEWLKIYQRCSEIPGIAMLLQSRCQSIILGDIVARMERLEELHDQEATDGK